MEEKENMSTRKEMKKKARASLKKHYLIFVIICVMATFMGSQKNGIFWSMEPNQSSDVDVVQTGTTSVSRGFNSVWNSILEGNLAESKEESKENLNEIKKNDTNRYLGHSRGVLAQVVNSFTSGTILVTIASAVSSIVKSPDVATVILVFLSMLFVGSIWAFILNVYSAVSARFFLEGRIYDTIPIRRFVFFLSIRKWFRAAWTLLYENILLTLWSFTIVGAVIKTYSYFLVPYIVAENPDMPAKTAVTLSRKMMNGHKWECFKLDLSFIGWRLLDVLPLGIVGHFYVNPYYEATMAEYYYQLRRLAKDRNIPGAELLNDRYLYEKPSEEVMEKAYGDVLALTNKPDADNGKRMGLRDILSNVFGIVLNYGEKNQIYEETVARNAKTDALKNILRGREYPFRLYPMARPEKEKDEAGLRYLRSYSVSSLIMMFFLLSFVGWLWEVSLHLITDGEFVNRGVLHGPWLPIYGTGGILILIVLNKFRSDPLKEFIATVVLCGCVEYFTSWYLEITHNGMKWWDYSGYFLNLNGRICAEGLCVFGLGGLAIVYLIAPLADDLLRKAKPRHLAAACAALLLIFSADQVYSSKNPNVGKGITDYQARAVSYEKNLVILAEAGKR